MEFTFSNKRWLTKEEIDSAINILTEFYNSGGTLICGSETGFSMTPYGEWHTREMGLFVKYLGLSPMEAILCMTRNSSITLPKHKNEIGGIESISGHKRV